MGRRARRRSTDIDGQETIDIGSNEFNSYGYSPPMTDEGREMVLIGLAIDEAERQIRNGTASSQILSHYLRLGTTREKLEKERLEREIEMLRAKTEALRSAKRVEELYTDALKAMREYSGLDGQSEDD